MDLKIVLPVGEPKLPTEPTSLTELTIGTDKYNINAEGNAVDAEGKVIKTKAELEVLKNPPSKTPEQIAEEEKLAKRTTEIEASLVEGTEVELDGVTYKLNKDGNAVDSTNKVIKTKAEIKELLLNAPESSDEVDYVSEIQKATNLTILDDKGNPITYENTVPGLAQYAQDVYNEGKKSGAKEVETTLYEKYPQLPSILEHLTLKGSLEGFVEEPDYSKIVLGDDEQQHIDIFTKAKKEQGLSDAEIKDMISYYKEDKKLKSVADMGLTYLKQKQTEKATERAKAISEAKAAEEAKRTAYWNNVDNIIQSKKIVVNDKTFAIPEVIKVKEADGKIVTKSIKDFQEYITKPLVFTINNQKYTMTQLQYDTEMEDIKRTPHHDLFDAYRKFTRYDDSQLIASNISSEVVKKVIKLNTKAGGGSGSTNKGGTKIVLPVK